MDIVAEQVEDGSFPGEYAIIRRATGKTDLKQLHSKVSKGEHQSEIVKENRKRL